MIQAGDAGVADLIGHQSIVVSREALKQVEERARETKDGKDKG